MRKQLLYRRDYPFTEEEDPKATGEPQITVAVVRGCVELSAKPLPGLGRSLIARLSPEECPKLALALLTAKEKAEARRRSR